MALPASETNFTPERPPLVPLPPAANETERPEAVLSSESAPPLQDLEAPGSFDSAFPPSPESSAASVPRLIPRERAYGLCALLLMGDWMAACVAIFVGLEFRDWQRTGGFLQPGALLDFQTSPIPWTLAGATLFVWLMVMFKTYEILNLYRMRLWSKNLLRSVVICVVVAWAYIGLSQATGYTPRIGVVYCALAVICLGTLWRLTSFLFLMQPDVREAVSSRLIVVGWNDKVAHLRMTMRRDLAHLVEIIGCVPMPGGAFASRPPAELAVLGDYPDLPRIVAECSANSIILSDVNCSAPEIQHLIRFCQREMIGFQMVPQYFPALYSGLRIQLLSGVPLLGVSQLPLDRTLNRTIKRVMDILGALAGLCVGAVLIPLFGLMVYWESPGPILFRQRRASRSGKMFYIWKIRTTPVRKGHSDDDNVDDENQGTLKIGRFMQKFDIDELPQFWNVLVGDMSLVGPCPERPELINKFRDEFPNYNARHEVRAGLTGWAQINGIKGDTDISRRIEGDLYYLENWSVMVDLYCIVATLFRAAGARSQGVHRG